MRSIAARFRLYVVWASISALVGLGGGWLYWTGVQRGRVGPRTPSGRALGIASLCLLGLVFSYTVRRRLITERQEDGDAERDLEREKRLEQLHERIADIQITGARRGQPVQAVRAAAVAAVRAAGLAGQLRVKAVGDGSSDPELRLVPRPQPGRLESWLKGHECLGTMVIPLMVLHAGLRVRGTVHLLHAGVAISAVASGLALSLTYSLVPRVLGRGEARGEPGAARSAPAARLMDGARYAHVALAWTLLAGSLLHAVA